MHELGIQLLRVSEGRTLHLEDEMRRNPEQPADLGDLELPTLKRLGFVRLTGVEGLELELGGKAEDLLLVREADIFLSELLDYLAEDLVLRGPILGQDP